MVQREPFLGLFGSYFWFVITIPAPEWTNQTLKMVDFDWAYASVQIPRFSDFFRPRFERPETPYIYMT